ncbi:MAG: WecB/TagA/CpsF family glycosyltransferase [Myxococcales bacterium]|nr:WecB/TagA/CpsF family glycosyltransferase [Myxococcales bacterium]
MMQDEETKIPGFEVCGTRIDALPPKEAAKTLVKFCLKGRKASVHLCNAYTLSLVMRNKGFRKLIGEGDLNLMDGMPLVWLAQKLGFSECQRRVYGPDLMLDVMDLGRKVGLRHYLYGSTPEVLKRLKSGIESRLEGVNIIASESPPFRALTPAEEGGLETRFRDSGAHVIWVGLGTPKQDHFVQRFRDRAPGPLVGVGAAFDFHAGLKKQAPAWLQDRGLEWAFRLGTEPKRLWRRYLFGNAAFILGVMKGARGLEDRALS